MSEKVSSLEVKPDIMRPRYDQKTYLGRAKHFFTIANPLNVFATEETLDKCKETVVDYKMGLIDPNMTVDELWRAKELYDSAFHPDSGEKMFILGRMSAQVPCNMLITGGMLSFYRSFKGVVFFHWLNQTFNACVNYTNRSGPNAVTTERLLVSYCCATGGALAVALKLNSLVKNAHGLAGRLVPFAAVALANTINIPMMRSLEFEKGIELRAERCGSLLATSQNVAALASGQVLVSRLAMAMPYMICTPLIMNVISKTQFYKTRTWIAAPLQTVLCGIQLTFTTPACCALFPQQSKLTITPTSPFYVEESVRTRLCSVNGESVKVWYNKGL